MLSDSDLQKVLDAVGKVEGDGMVNVIIEGGELKKIVVSDIVYTAPLSSALPPISWGPYGFRVGLG